MVLLRTLKTSYFDLVCRLRSYVCWSWPFLIYGHSGWL